MEVDVGAGALGALAGVGQCGRGEVQAGHPSAQSRERQCVGADVALQVHTTLLGQIAHPWTVESDHATQILRIDGESIEP
jgi:hypothetical protein